MKQIMTFFIGLLSSALLLNLAHGFGGDNRMNGNFFEDEPINSLDPREILKQRQLEAKIAANNLIADPIPGERLLGPSLSKFVDPQSLCTIGDIYNLNESTVLSTVKALQNSTFFRYFKVDLDAECPYWVIDKICKNGGSCTIGRCEEEEIPSCVRAFDGLHKNATSLPFSKVRLGKLPEDFSSWDDVDENMWALTQLDSANPNASYVDLTENVESNTGYSGEEPRMIWNAIYNENCFRAMASSDVEQMCSEERLFYRLISGMHTEISVHVFAKWKRDVFTMDFVPNQGLWNMVFGKFPERFDSLFYTLNFLIESFHAIEPYKNRVLTSTGSTDEKVDSTTRHQFESLLAATNSCNFAKSSKESEIPVYSADEELSSVKKTLHKKPTKPSTIVDGGVEDEDEDEVTQHFPAQPLFETASSFQLRDQLKSMFRNVSLIMNCVGCEKCRVWSKVHTLGLATALKVSLSKPGPERAQIAASLQRNELVALVNSIASFSEAVHYVGQFMDMQPNPTTLDVTTPFEADTTIPKPSIFQKIPAMFRQTGCSALRSAQAGLRKVSSYLPLFYRFPLVDDDQTPSGGASPRTGASCIDLEKLGGIYVGLTLFLVFVALVISFFRCDGDDGTKNRSKVSTSSSSKKNIGNNANDGAGEGEGEGGGDGEGASASIRARKLGYREFQALPFGTNVHQAQQHFEELDISEDEM